MKNLLPSKMIRADYPYYKANPNLWVPALGEICEKHHLNPEGLSPITEGSNLVAKVGEDFILKVFPPFLRFQWESERLALQQLVGKVSIPTPKLLQEGEKDGWTYLIMTLLPGTSLKQIWSKLNENQKNSLLKQIGSLIAEVHQVESRPLTGLSPQWSSFLPAQRAAALARHERLGLPAKYLKELEPYLDEHTASIPSVINPVILTGEYTPENILVNEDFESIKILGLIDFGDTMVGPAVYDLLGPATFLACGDSSRLRSLFLGYGYSERDLNPELQHQLMMLLLLHRYSNLSIQICIENWDTRAQDLKALEKLVFNF